jgi:hypothetical protein
MYTNSKQKLIRRSLKTKNRREALKHARRMWILIEDSNSVDSCSMDNLKSAEEEYELHKQKCSIGAKVSEHG